MCTHPKVNTHAPHQLGWARECALILTVLVGQREPIPQGAEDPARNRRCRCVVESWSEKGILELGEYAPFFGNNQANSSFVGSLRCCACWQTAFITGNRNALISKRAPSLRVRRFTNFRYCLSFPSFAESVHKRPVCWLFGMQTHPRGDGMSPSKLWDGLAAGSRTASAPWLRHTGLKGSPKDFFLSLWSPIPSSAFLIV